MRCSCSQQCSPEKIADQSDELFVQLRKILDSENLCPWATMSALQCAVLASIFVLSKGDTGQMGQTTDFFVENLYLAVGAVIDRFDQEQDQEDAGHA